MHPFPRPFLCIAVKTNYSLPFLNTVTRSPMATTNCQFDPLSKHINVNCSLLTPDALWFYF